MGSGNDLDALREIGGHCVEVAEVPQPNVMQSVVLLLSTVTVLTCPQSPQDLQSASNFPKNISRPSISSNCHPVFQGICHPNALGYVLTSRSSIKPALRVVHCRRGSTRFLVRPRSFGSNTYEVFKRKIVFIGPREPIRHRPSLRARILSLRAMLSTLPRSS